MLMLSGHHGHCCCIDLLICTDVQGGNDRDLKGYL